jgi:hypothetical protein
VLFAGDVCYQKQLISNSFAGGNSNHKESVRTYARIRFLAKSTKLFFFRRMTEMQAID